MGFNSAIFILNDTLWDIRNDQNWRQKVVTALAGADSNVVIEGTGGGTRVFHCSHMDYVEFYAIGNNLAVRLLSNNNDEYITEQELNVFTRIANKYGLPLIKTIAEKFDHKLIKKG